MRESQQTVRIERHRVGDDITVITFEAADATDAAPTPTPRRPLVFVVHGLQSRKERHVELCLLLAEAGFLACTLDARHHGERATPETMALLGGRMSAGFALLFAEAVMGTAQDVGALADYFGRERYGLIGHSMGGYVALKTAVHDPRAAVVVSIAGNPDWTILPEGVFLPPEALMLARAESPITYPDRFWPRPLLLLHGDADPVVPVRGDRALHELLTPRYAEDPGRLSLVEYPRVGHEFTPDMAARAVAWMTRYLDR